MKRLTLGLASLTLAGVLAGCMQTGEAQMERTVTINNNVQLESSLADNLLSIQHSTVALPENIDATDSDLGFVGSKLYLNTKDGIYVFDVESQQYTKVMDGVFHAISENGQRALLFEDQEATVYDFFSKQSTRIGTYKNDYLASFANAEGTALFFIEDGPDEGYTFEFVDVETKETQSWATADILGLNGLTLAAKKATNGIYVVGNSIENGQGLHNVQNDHSVETLFTTDADFSVSQYDILSPTTVLFTATVDGQPGIYIKNRHTEEVSLLVAGGEDDEGIWTPSYSLSPDQTKLMFDTPVQVGDDYKANVYVAEIEDGKLVNTSRLIENGDLYAIISLSGRWSADSTTAYITTYHPESFTLNAIEKFVIE